MVKRKPSGQCYDDDKKGAEKGWEPEHQQTRFDGLESRNLLGGSKTRESGKMENHQLCISWSYTPV